MHARPLVPCLWLDDQAEPAAAFYAARFPGGRRVATSRYPRGADNPAGKPRGSVLTVEVELAGHRFTLLNGGPLFRINPTISFFVELDQAAEVDRLAQGLLEGGQALMPLEAYPWSPRYAWVVDRFGVSWQVMARQAPAGAPALVPCLMFAGAVHGQAEAALRHYARLFPGGQVGSLSRYAAGEGPVGTVKHGRVALAGQELAAMDSHLHQGPAFNEAVSLQVRCDGQAELDRLWAGLGEGGKPGVCGWLQDRFGVSWQVTPAELTGWMGSADEAARDRTFQAMMGMGRPDVATLQAAFQGR